MQIPDRKVVVGNPARVTREVSDEIGGVENRGHAVVPDPPGRFHASLVPCEPLREAPSDVRHRNTIFETWHERRVRGDGADQ